MNTPTRIQLDFAERFWLEATEADRNTIWPGSGHVRWDALHWTEREEIARRLSERGVPVDGGR